MHSHHHDDTRRIQTVNRRKRVAKAPKIEESDSDEEYELEKRPYTKRSNVKRPIDQGFRQLSRKRHCFRVC